MHLSQVSITRFLAWKMVILLIASVGSGVHIHIVMQWGSRNFQRGVSILKAKRIIRSQQFIAVLSVFLKLNINTYIQNINTCIRHLATPSLDRLSPTRSDALTR